MDEGGIARQLMDIHIMCEGRKFVSKRETLVTKNFPPSTLVEEQTTQCRHFVFTMVFTKDQDLFAGALLEAYY